MAKFLVEFKNDTPTTIESDSFRADPHFIEFINYIEVSRTDTTGKERKYRQPENVAAIQAHLVKSVRKVEDDKETT